MNYLLGWIHWLNFRVTSPLPTFYQKCLLNKLSQMGTPIYINHECLSRIFSVSEKDMRRNLGDLEQNKFITIDNAPFGINCDIVKITVEQK